MSQQDSAPFGKQLTSLYKAAVTATEDEKQLMIIDVKKTLILYAENGRSSIDIKDLKEHIQQGAACSAKRVRSTAFDDAFLNALQVMNSEGVLLKAANSAYPYLCWGG